MVELRSMINRGLALSRLHHSVLALTVGVFILVALPYATQAQIAVESRQWVAPAKPSSTMPKMPIMPSRLVSFETAEGTFMSVDVSPDGEMLVFDLLGDLYSLPISGGDAIPLTTGSAWDQAPRFSLDGEHVYFVSDREGYRNIWRLVLADQSLQQVTYLDSDVRGGPNWAQDSGQLLVGVGDAETHGTEVALHIINLNSGSPVPVEQRNGPWLDWDRFEPLRLRIMAFSGVQSVDGVVYFSEAQYEQMYGSRKKIRIYAVDVKTQIRTSITPKEASYSEYKPQLSRDGRLLAYFRQYNNRRTELRVLDRSTGNDELLTALIDADDASYTFDDDSRPNYSFTPDDRQLIFWHGGKIRRVDIDDGSNEIVPFRAKVEREVWARVQPTAQHIAETGEAVVIRWPSLSLDGQTMTFAAIGYVWVMDLQMGTIRRLTRSNDFEYMPALSPDGTSVAFVSFAESDYASGRLMIADVDSGIPREVLADQNVVYLLPKWSSDSEKIAVIREVENDSGLEAAFGWTQTMNGVFRKVAASSVSSDFASTSIYARFVSFDTSCRSLLFSFPRSKTETVLGSANLDGSSLRTLAVGTPEVGGITPAPDLSSVALTGDNGTVWVAPFAAHESESVVSTSAPDTYQISTGGGYYIDWNRSNRITYGFGNNVYRYSLHLGSLESLRVKLEYEKPKAAQPIAFVGARLVFVTNDDVAGPKATIESGTIVFEGQRISAVGPMGEVPISASAKVIDATDKTIMPGFIDTHYHRVGGGSGAIGASAFKLPNNRFSDRSAIMYGITSAWEPGGASSDGVPATVDLQVAGRILGPRWSHAAMGAIGYPYEQLNSYAASIAAVEQHRELGVTLLKEYLAPTRQQRQWLAAAAYEKQLGIVSHIETFYGMMTRTIDGYTGGDHPYIPAPLFKDVYELLRQTGYVWTPNTLITPATIGLGQRKSDYFCHAVSAWRTRSGYTNRNANSICPSDQVSLTEPYDIHRFSRVAIQAASAANYGVNIGVSAHNMPGSNLHMEMWYLWKGGMPIEDVLRATTIGNAKKLGLQEEVGSLEIGKIADFLVLDENPLDDILNTMSLKYTVQGGVVYDSSTAERVDVAAIASVKTGGTAH